MNFYYHFLVSLIVFPSPRLLSFYPDEFWIEGEGGVADSVKEI